MMQNNLIESVPFDASHVKEIAEIEILSFSLPWSEAAISEEIENPISYWLVAKIDGRVVGYIGSQIVLDEADIMNIAVHPDYRRKSIGHALLKQLIQDLINETLSFMTLEVRPSNISALNLYLSFGFYQIGRRPNYYKHPKEDALIRRKELKQ